MIANIQLGVTETTICQAGALETRAVLSMLFCNTDSVTRTITIYAYPSTGSANAISTILSQYSIPGGDTFVWTANEKFILAPNDKISGIADIAAMVSVLTNYMVI
jgi:hypothetical protein